MLSVTHRLNSLHTSFNIAHHTLILGFRYLWALKGIGLERVTDHAGSLDVFFEILDELVVYAVLDENTRCCRADLTLVGHDTNVAPLDGLLKVRVREDQKRRFSTCL